ncbi:MAG: NAD/NADP octopine/nopaline dehydrogenase family protein [Deltaproteobacteria bacterium]|nr:NAD/NADP octopine/nopaline dehydrogenase family protein [Deltaproteobacteria bacterium]MBF0524748.1 NAD/NADP octopine/nopaline dehydrogenase family protein [Deltaproteobacteria bacterium]
MSIYAVLGAGSGGQTLAALLTLNGHKVKLWNRSADRTDAIRRRGRIEVSGQMNFHVTIDTITNDISEAIEEARLIFIVVPADAHKEIAGLLANHIKSDQGIILNPGRTLGFLEVRNTLTQRGLVDLPIILETQSLFCSCRSVSPGQVNILSFKKDNLISCIPKGRFIEVHDQLLDIYRNLTLAPSPLHTSLENIGAILHPAPVLLNTGWIESRKVFFPHYYDAISPSVAGFLELMDIERLSVADRYGVKVRSVKKWHEDVYGEQGESLYETLQKNSSYAEIDAPRTLIHRYLTEDIPTGLVPISELGRAGWVPTPFIDIIILLGSTLMGYDFRANGRNLHRMGLAGMNFDTIKTFLSDYPMASELMKRT